MGVVSRVITVGDCQTIKESPHGSFVISNDLGCLYDHGLPEFHATAPQKEISPRKTAKPFPNLAGWPHGLPDATHRDVPVNRSQLDERSLDHHSGKKRAPQPTRRPAAHMHSTTRNQITGANLVHRSYQREEDRKHRQLVTRNKAP